MPYEEASSITAIAHTELWQEPWLGWRQELTRRPSVRPATSWWGDGAGRNCEKGVVEHHVSSSTWAEMWTRDCLMASPPCSIPTLVGRGGEGRAAAGIPPSVKTPRDPPPVLLEPAQLYSRAAWGPDLKAGDMMTFLTVAILSISRVSLKSGSRNQCTAQQMMSVLAAAQHRVGARREAHEAISCLHLI